MKRILLGLVLTGTFSVATAETTAFVNVNVVPMNAETIVAGQTVIVRDERIVQIGTVDDTVLPDDAFIVDGTDRFLMPGLAEMHGHVTGTSDAELDRLFALYLANGVTTIRGMLGRPAHLELRDSLEAGERLGPRLGTSGPSFNGNSVNGAGRATERVRAQHAAGYDFLKIHPGLTAEEFAAIADEATALGIPFAGHVPAAVGVQGALSAGMASIDHLDGYMQALLPAPPLGGDAFFGLMLAGDAVESRIDGIVAATVAAGTWNVPTETLFEHTANGIPPGELADWPEMRFVPASTVADWVSTKEELLSDPQFDRETADRAIALRRLLIAELHAAGAGLLLGSDSPQRFNVPGYSLHRELSILVEAGLSPYEALRTGTVNAAIFFGETDERGTVETGRVADLVLVDDNPLANISNASRVHGTMVRGTWLDRSELDRMLEAARTN